MGVVLKVHACSADRFIVLWDILSGWMLRHIVGEQMLNWNDSSGVGLAADRDSKR